MIEFEMVAEQGRSIGEESAFVSPSVSIETENSNVAELRSQLNHFLLKLLAFNDQTTNVPPIISGDLMPFGIEVSRTRCSDCPRTDHASQILVNPTSHPFFNSATSNPTAEAAYPLLFRTLVTPKGALSTGDGSRGFSR